MEIAVLLKAVPRSEAVRFDPVRRATVREGVELVLNPFDHRALRVGLELRRPGDAVTVLSLGPPPVRPLLREALALGADRALHLCDDAFAGSDLLASSAAIAAALRPIGAGLILAGARSTDSDTGLLGPELAARLDVPVLSSARSVRRTEPDGHLAVEVDTPRGYARFDLPLPAVVTVGEKAAKPLHGDPAAFDRVDDGRVRTLGPGALGVEAGEVGAFGSPTRVEAVEEVAPHRSAVLFAEGTPAERAAAALAAVRARLTVRRPAAAPLPWPPSGQASREVVVLVSGHRGELTDGALSVIGLLRRSLPAHRVAAVSYGAGPASSLHAELEGAGALAGYRLAADASAFDSADVAGGLSALLEVRPRLAAVVAVASPFGRDVAGQFAARGRLGVVGDAVAVAARNDGGFTWSKPSFGGTTLARIACRSVPAVVTVPGGLAEVATDGRAGAPFRWTDVRSSPPRARVRCLEEHDEPAELPEVDGAEVVVAVGSGIGGPEGIARLLPVLERWGAALVGTRRVVDAGWLPVRRQLGLTGRSLAPRLAVLLGVRGATNHMVGWARAGTILAVNVDPEAPVFRGADVGIVGRLEEVVPELVEPLALALGRGPAVRR